MGLPVACVDISILDGVAAMQHNPVTHINAHMGNARCVISAGEKHQIAGSDIGG